MCRDWIPLLQTEYGESYYTAVIEKRNQNGTYQVIFDCDGEEYSECPEGKIRLLDGDSKPMVDPVHRPGRFPVDAEVQAQTMKDGSWYEGVVVSYDAAECSYKIEFTLAAADGTKERLDVPESRVHGR